MQTVAHLASQLPLPIRPMAAPEEQPGEHRIVISDVSWGGYCAVRELLDNPGLRMAYADGELEIMSPSKRHEKLKILMGRLVETFAVARGIPLTGLGSTTFRSEAKARGAEPDECYSLGSGDGDVPDLAIEVVLSSGGLDKLDIYAGLGVREVWIWQADQLEVYVLVGGSYQPVERSSVLPDLDLTLLAAHVRMPVQHEAVQAFAALVRA